MLSLVLKKKTEQDIFSNIWCACKFTILFKKQACLDEPKGCRTNIDVNIFRKDEVKGQISKEDVFRNAPLHDDQFFKVPKVIKK